MVQPLIFTRYPRPRRRMRTPSGQVVHLHSLSAARKAYPDPGWCSRSSSLGVRLQEGVSGPRVVQPFIFTRSPLPGRRIQTPDGPAVHLHSLCATGKAYPDRDWPYRSSSLAIRRQEGVSGPRVAQPFIFIRYPLPGGRIRTASGPGVPLHSLSAAKKAYPDPEWPSRSSSLATRRQEGVAGSREVQPFIFSHYPPPGRRIWTPSGPAVPLHSLPAARKASPDPGRSSRSSSVTIRHLEGVSGPRVVQPFILLAIRRKARRIRTPSGPAVHLHSLSAARWAYPDREWSRCSSSLAIRRQEGVSGPRVAQPFIFTRYPLPGGPIRTASGPGVHLHSLSAAKKAYPDPEWPSRSSSLAIRCQVGVSGPRVVQPLIFTRYPRPRRRMRTPSGQVVHLHSLSAARKAYPDPGWCSRSSSLGVRLQEGVSGPRVVQPFIFTRSPLPGRRIQTPDGPAVHLHSLCATGKAYPDRDWPYRSSSLAIRRQEGVSGPRVAQPFIFIRYPLPGGRIRTASGPGVPLHSLSAAKKAYPDPEWPSRSSSLATRRQEGVAGSREVQPFIFSHYPPPGRRIWTPSGPAVPLHSLPAARKASPDPGRSSRSSSVTIRHLEGVSGPRVVQPFILLAIRRKARRIRTPSGPAVHLHSLSAARWAYPEREWSRCSSSLAIRRQEGVSGPRVAQPFIFTRYPLPGGPIRTASGPGVHLHSLSAAKKAYPDPEWPSRSSSLAIRCQVGVSGPRVVQPLIFTRYPRPRRRMRTPSGQVVHLHSLSAARKAYPDPGWCSRSSSLGVRLQEGVSGPRVVQPFIFTRSPLPGRRIQTPDGPAVHLHSLCATGKAYPDRDWPYRSSSLAIRRQEGVSGPRVAQPFIFIRYPLPGGRIRTASGPGVPLHSLSAAKKAYPDPEWPSRSSSLATRRQEGVAGSREVQPFIFSHYPPPGRRIWTPSGPAVPLHSLPAARKASPDPGRSSRSSSVTIRHLEGVSGPRVVQPFILLAIRRKARRIRTPSGPAVHLHSLSAARWAYPDREWSRCSSSLAIRRQEGVSGPRVAQPFIFTRYPLPGGPIRTASGPGVHLHSLSAAKKAYPDPEWPSRSSSLAIRCQVGVSGPRVVQPLIFTRYPRPRRRMRTPSGQVVHLHSLSAARKAYPDPGWCSRSSSLGVRLQEGVSGPRVVQPFIFTRSPLPGRRIQTPDGPAVHLHSLCATGKAYPDRDWPYRSSSLAIRRQEGVSGPRVAQPFIFIRYPLPGGRIRTASGPGVPLHSLSAAKKAYPDPEWPSRSSSLATRRQEGVAGSREVQPFIFSHYPPPGRRIWTPSGPAVPLHSLPAARKASPDPGRSSRSSSVTIRHLEGVSGPRVDQPFILLASRRKARHIRTPSGPAVHLHSLSAARWAYPDREWSRRSSSLAIRRQEAVSGPRGAQPFIFTRYPLPGGRIRTTSGPGVHLHSLSAARWAYPDREWSSRSSSLAIRGQEGVSGPRVAQPFIFTRYPLPGGRIRTASGPGVHLHSLSAAKKAYPDPEWPSRSSSLAIRCQVGVSGPRMVQPLIFTRYPRPRRRIRTPSGQVVHLHSLSAARWAYPDHEWSRRSSSLAIRCQVGVSGPRVVQPFIFTRYPRPRRRIRTPSGPAVHLHSLSAARWAYPDREWSSRSSSLTMRHR